MKGGIIVIKTKLDTKSFEAQINSLERDLAEYERLYEMYANAGRKLTEEEAEDFEKLKVKIEQTKNKIIDLTRRQMDFKGMSSSIGGVIKKVARWGLALFGIRSAYMGIRSAIGLLSQDNQKLAADIQYIKWSLAKVLEPVITRIINWVYKLIQAINYLIYRITGVNLLSKSMAKNFKSGAKSAKEMQKTLQGFDEANILDTTSSGGGGGTALPSEDLSKFNLLSEDLINTLNKIGDVLKPIWKNYLEPIGKWIIEKPDHLLAVLGGILGLKLASKIAKIIGVAGSGSAAAGASGLLGMLGILGLLVADVWLVKIAVEGTDEVVKEARKLKDDVDDLNQMTKSGAEYWAKTRGELYETAKTSEEADEKLRILADGLLKNVENNEALAESVQKSRTWLEIFDGTGGKNVDTIRTLNKEIEGDIELLKEMAHNHELTDTQLQKLQQRYVDQINSVKAERDEVRKNSWEYEQYTKKINSLEKELAYISGEDYTIDVETDVERKELDNLEKSLDKVTKGATINVKADTKEANKTVKGWLSKMGSAVFGAMFPALNYTSTVSKFNRMGGIINLPNKGVPIVNRGGESGPEGVIPMDEKEQMDILGESIARHVIINFTNITKLNAREIARETRQVNAENDFATNGGVR